MKIKKIMDWFRKNNVRTLQEEVRELKKQRGLLSDMNLGLKEAAEAVLKGKCPNCGYRLGDRKNG